MVRLFRLGNKKHPRRDFSKRFLKFTNIALYYSIRKSISVWVFVVPFLASSIREISYIKANAMVNIGKVSFCSPPYIIPYAPK